MPNKRAFPALVEHPELIYLDTAATAQKPLMVLDAVRRFQWQRNGSPNRGAHKLSIEATRAYDNARETVQRFIGAPSADQVVFTGGTTESLNMIAYSWAMAYLQPGDKIVLSITSHHSNILPFQMAAEKTGAVIDFLDCAPDGTIPTAEWEKIDDKTKLVSLPLVSNGIGVHHDVKSAVRRARAVGAVVVLDAAQAAGHVHLDVQALDCDFLAFSGHKLYGPQGIGVLYGKQERLEEMQPFFRGGDMIEYVTREGATFAPLPQRLEAGTQNVAGAVGLAEAVRFVEGLGVVEIARKEAELTRYASKKLASMHGVTLYGPEAAARRGSMVVFNVDGIHPHDVASLLDEKGIAIRAGHHCCQPLMQHLGLQSTCRASFGVYTEKEDIDRLVDGLKAVQEVFGHGAA